MKFYFISIFYENIKYLVSKNTMEWSMRVLDNPDLINNSSILINTDLLDSHMGGVGKIKPRVTIVCCPECRPVRMSLVENVVS